MNINKLKLFIFIVSLFLILCCKKDEYEFRLSGFDIPIITGYYIRSEFGDYMGVVGNPNVYNENSNSEYVLRLFPNPATERSIVYIKSPTSMTNKKIWITQAQYEVHIPNYSIDIGSTNLRAGGMPLIQAEFSDNYFEIDCSILNEGYYRIYLKIDALILYDNLVIYNPNK